MILQIFINGIQRLNAGEFLAILGLKDMYNYMYKFTSLYLFISQQWLTLLYFYISPIVDHVKQ